MERSKYIIGFKLLIVFSLLANQNYKKIIYNAYINNNMQKWQQVINTMHYEKNKSDEYVLELLNYYYGYIGWCIGQKRIDEAEKYLNQAKKYLDILESKNYKLSTLCAYKSAFYGFELGISWYKAPILGPKSVSCAKDAIKYDNNNPLGYIEYGNTQYYMPSSFGGSKEKAIEYYKKAQQLMERDEFNIKENWNYINLLTRIGQAYLELENYQNAKLYFDKILNIEPNFTWVKDELYPKLKNKMSDK